MATASPADWGTPPWARSLLPPPRPPSLAMRLFQERAHVVGLARGLREDERGLRRLGGEQARPRREIAA